MQLYSFILYLLDSVCFLFKGPGKEGSRKKVLFVRLDTIGDFVLWLDAVKELRNLFPAVEYQLTLLGNKDWTPLATRLPYFDEVIGLDRRLFLKNLPYRLRLLKTIRSSGFQVVIDPTYSRQFLFSEAVVRVSGAEERITSQGDCTNIRPWQKRVSDRWYTRHIPSSKGVLMELLRNAEFMRGLGLPDFKAGLPELPVSNHLPEGIDIENYYVIFPGASVKLKQWPLSHFMELSMRIYLATGWQGIVCGGPGEHALGRALEQYEKAPLRNWVGRTSLMELSEIIAGARFLVSNDTAAVHIAAAVSTPAICILWGGHFGRFLPYRLEKETDRPLPVAVYNKLKCFGCNWNCVHGATLSDVGFCVSSITVDVVWDAVRQILP